ANHRTVQIQLGLDQLVDYNSMTKRQIEQHRDEYRAAYIALNYGSKRAITFGETQYYKKQLAPNDTNQTDLLGHEFFHSMQYRQMGYEQFLEMYAASVIANLQDGVWNMKAFRIEIELQAEAFQMVLARRTQMLTDLVEGRMRTLSEQEKAQI